MAGDTVEIGRAAFLMIHNCWIVAIGNANDLRAAADTCAPFDSAMADVYAARTGIDAKKISQDDGCRDLDQWEKLLSIKGLLAFICRPTKSKKTKVK